jgi:membrane protein DedA with SNARE-associated domain/rhodanese-related sulfurtransferase
VHTFIESLLSQVPRHGYSILFLLVFLESVGIPIPAAPALLIAGAAAARGSLQPALAGAYAFSALMLGDTLMFVLGRYTGWWLLGLLCRLSLNPESCILSSADSFYRRGRMVLLFAKFVPGINTMAPPLAGSMNMPYGQFLRLDATGATLYVSAYISLGFVFSGALGPIVRGYRAFGSLVVWVVLAAVAAYLGVQVRTWIARRSLAPVPSARPEDVARALAAGEALIYDVRSHGYYHAKALRIRGSRRMEPNALDRFQDEIPPGKAIYLYCTCARQETSTLVARALLEKGLRSSVIDGGLRAWRRAGLPIERVPAEEMAAMPDFGLRSPKEIQVRSENV